MWTLSLELSYLVNCTGFVAALLRARSLSRGRAAVLPLRRAVAADFPGGQRGAPPVPLCGQSPRLSEQVLALLFGRADVAEQGDELQH